MIEKMNLFTQGINPSPEFVNSLRSLTNSCLSPRGEAKERATISNSTETKRLGVHNHVPKGTVITPSPLGERVGVRGADRKVAFTLAEVLITLAVIGVVAALTIPSLVENHNAKAWATAKDLWQKKLVEVTRRMNVDGVMTGYSTTEDYFDTFKKYVKVIKTCDSNDINTCYSPKVVSTGKNGEIEVETSGLKTANDLGLKDFGTNTMSFVIADGTTVIMAYNPKCTEVDPFSQEAQAGQVGCMGMMIDVNGKKGPNRVGKDIQLSEGVAFSTCDNPIGDYCWSTDFAANTAIDTCTDTTYDETGSSNPYCSKNYWAGAKKTCEEKGMELPTMEQLADLASTIYGADIKRETWYSGAPKDEYKNALTIGYYYWSSEQYPDLTSDAYKRLFESTYSNYSWNNKDVSGYRAVCVGR